MNKTEPTSFVQKRYHFLMERILLIPIEFQNVSTNQIIKLCIRIWFKNISEAGDHLYITMTENRFILFVGVIRKARHSRALVLQSFTICSGHIRIERVLPLASAVNLSKKTQTMFPCLRQIHRNLVIL